jgi:hypothetical protein
MDCGKAIGRLSIAGEPPFLFEKILTPEEVGMSRDSLTELIGEGDARITTALELKDSNYGTGFGAYVSVTLTVDQTEQGMEAGYGLSLDLAQRYVEEAFDTAQILFQKLEREGKVRK